MTVRLVLVSHAATAATREARFPADESLDEHGAAGAAACSGVLRRIGPVFSGPELRCRQTAEALGLGPVTDPALADWGLGGWRGRTLTELGDDQPSGLHAWMTDPGAAPHGGETLHDLLDRAAAWLDGLAAGPARIAAITHPAFVRAAVLYALQAPPVCFWRLDVAPLSQTWLSRHDGRWRLRETGHPLTPAAG
jgi:broad specificity phosphatase PhoE